MRCMKPSRSIDVARALPGTPSDAPAAWCLGEFSAMMDDSFSSVRLQRRDVRM